MPEKRYLRSSQYRRNSEPAVAGLSTDTRKPCQPFYDTLNQSGVKPVESLADLPTSENDEVSTLSSDQREYLVNILFEQMELTTEQREKLTGYAVGSNINNRSQMSSISQEDGNDDRLFESRIDDYDEYMLAVDMARLLKPATERLDIPANPEESDLLSELKSAEKRRNELYEVSK